MNITLIAVIIYMIAQFAIAIYCGRLVKSESDYLLAGRQIGLLLTTFSIFANWFGAETVVASSGAIAAEGLSGGRAEPFGYAVCLVLFGLLIAYRMRAGEYLTMSDFYRSRFGIVNEKLSVLLVIPTSLIWSAAQVTAFAHILASISQIEFDQALLIGTIIIVLYTTIGGFLGDVIADFVQGIFVILGLVATAIAVVIYMGGIGAVIDTITPEKLSLISPDLSLSAQFDSWMIAVVGSLVAQEAISRMLAARSPEIARRASFNAAGMYFFIGLIPVFIGLIGASIIPLPENADTFLPELTKTILPTYVYIMFIGALISAILSTVDSTLLSIGALTGHNIVGPFLPNLKEKQKVLLQRGMVILAGILTYFIATAGDSIYDLIEMSSSFGSAGLLICLLFGLWTKIGGWISALTTMIVGTVSAYLLQYHWEWDAGYVASLGFCVLAYLIVAVLERKFYPRGLHVT